MFTHHHYTDWIILICKSSVLSRFFLCRHGISSTALMKSNLSRLLQHAMESTQENSASSWLTALPVKEFDFVFHKGAFCDSLALIMDGNPFKHPPLCCGSTQGSCWSRQLGICWRTKWTLLWLWMDDKAGSPSQSEELGHLFYPDRIELLKHRYLASSPRKCTLLNTVWIQNLHMGNHACFVSVQSDAFMFYLFVCLFLLFFLLVFWIVQAESHIRPIIQS